MELHNSLPSNHNSSSSGGEWEEPEGANHNKWVELLSGVLPLVDRDSLGELDLNSNNKRSEEWRRECHNRTNNLEPLREQLAPPSNNNLDHSQGQPNNPPSNNLEEEEGGSLVHSNNSSLEDRGDNSNREVVEGSTGAVELLALQVDSHNRVEEVSVL